MTNQITFIHAADLHLDSPFVGMGSVPETIFQEIRNSTFATLDQLVTVAIEKQVDFIILVGDLFDNEKQSLKAQIRLRRAFEQLKDHHISVYLSYGNHDHLNGNIYPVTYPDNVFIFPSEAISEFVFERNDKPMAAIYGFSYENRAVLQNKAIEYKIVDPSIPFHIGTLHGSLHTNTDHDTYAPFKISDLTVNFDYWALGHIHKRNILKKDPLIIYPGNTQGRNVLETGEKGCYIVTISEGKADKTFIPLQSIQFITLKIDVSLCKEIHQLELAIQKEIKKAQGVTPQLIELILDSRNEKLMNWNNNKLVEEIIELVNDTTIHRKNWSYIHTYEVKVNQALVDQQLYKGDHFIGELLREFDEVSIQSLMEDISKHRQGRKYVQALEEVESETIKDKAKALLINELLNY